MGTPDMEQAPIEGKLKSTGNLSSLIAGRDIVIVLSAFIVLTVLGIFIVQHYTTSDDAAAVLGVLIPAISTIAGTAFGVSAGVKAGAAAGDATAQAAKTETQAVRTEAQTMRTQTTDAFANLAEAKTKLDPVIDAAGSKGTQLPADQLQEARTQLENAEQSLKNAL